MPQAEVNGIRLNYWDTGGDGEPVVLVMGMAATGRVWQLHQVPALTAAGYRVVSFDNRGIAPSSECGEGFKIDDMVADTAALIEHLGLGPSRLVGTSLGAQVVQELALARPELVTRIALLATRGRVDAMRKAARAADRELRASGLRLPARFEAVIRAQRNLSPKTLSDEAKLRDWLDVFEFSPVNWTDGLRAQLELDMTENRLPAYRAITAQALVIGFADDAVLPAFMAREVAEAIPGGRYLELADCGHYGYLERPEAVNEALLEFLAR